MNKPTLDEERRLAFGADVRAGLSATPKVLPPKYFYDALGSLLFEAICRLPWYPITRAETRLLEPGAAEMIAPLANLAEVVELGSGSGSKIAILARALSARGRPFDVHLVDISDTALELGRAALAAIPGARVMGHRASYEVGLSRLAPATIAQPARPRRGARLVCLLGSNIGNFDPPDAAALLVAIRGALAPGDGLLLGADLVKPEPLLLVAYDDPLGVTAAFNKNLLQRMNAELGADFDLAAFAHRAVWDRRSSRVEMHLVSRGAQRVRVPGAALEATFADGETIWTESSYKHTLAGLVLLGTRAGLSCRRQWVDDEGGFATSLFVVE
jgi:dimethylhistidine N-methyltransferase